MSVVGVDFGYQNSVIAVAGRGGVDVILNGNSNRLNPSMVAFDRSRKMGELAGAGAVSNYKTTILAMKRLIGLSWDDPRAKSEISKLAFKCVPIKHSAGHVDTIGVSVPFDGEERVIPMEAVAGMLLKHVGEIAAKKAAQDTAMADPNSNGAGKLDASKFFPQDWVIAIPNYFTDAQRRAMLTSCEIAGISGVQRLMHENTATALAYGIFKDLKKEFSKENPSNVMFIDFGASAYSVSIATFEPGKLTVRAAYCDADLGGRDFDFAIANWIAAKFQEKHKNKLSGKPMEEDKPRMKLLAAAEKAKKTLSPQGVREARINVEMLMDDHDFSISLSAEEYETLSKPILDRLAEPIRKAMAEAGIASAKDLASIELVGGSTRIGCVKRKLSEIFGPGCQLSTTMNADEAVARGAALQSAILSPRFKVLPYEIVEAQPYPIKISWQDDAEAAGVEVDANGEDSPTDSVIMFDRGLSFPIVRRVTLRRSGEFVVESKYDESSKDEYGLPLSQQGKSIAKFTIQAPVSEEEKRVRVNVKEDIHGIIHLSSAQMVEEIDDDAAAAPAEGGEAKEGEEGGEKKKKIRKTNLDYSVSRPLDWSKEEINKAYEAEVAMANADRVVKETADMRNELESYIYDMRDKIYSDSGLAPFCSEQEKADFANANEKMENWLYEEGFDATKKVYADKLAELKKIGGPIEQRQYEAQARPAALNSLQANLDQYKNWVNDSQTNERFSHITDEERQKVHALCDEISAWMYEMLDKQGGMADNQNPALTVSALTAKNKQLVDTCLPIINRPKPLPKKVDVPKPEAPPAASANSGGTEPMDGVEKTDGENMNGETKMEVDA